MRNNELLIYQGKNGEIILKDDSKNETIWASQKQIAEVFGIDRTVVTKHINKIFKDSEIDEKSNVQKMHIANSDKPVKFYNLDIILAIGYRTNSAKAIEFRKWATKTLKEHITKGFTINSKRLEQNYEKFLQAVEDVKKILPENSEIIKNTDILELVKNFANTWFNLESYDEDKLPVSGFTIKDLEINSLELYKDVAKFKEELIELGQATELFSQEKTEKSLEGILGNVFQTFDGEDVYPTLEEKAAHLLYFVVKNHPFTDGNKRTGAFSFIWFLNRIGFNFREKITPEALTVMTLLVAESNPKDKQRIVGLIILLLKK
ncbi:MAG: virulence protein RhuM/Fic/DOC family protein [Candidatus Gracilibacteria bacterium]|nr:virulence protein RhuM/Fic/DOC family protein [Candidatus Gracilibacteria bacterium]